MRGPILRWLFVGLHCLRQQLLLGLLESLFDVRGNGVLRLRNEMFGLQKSSLFTLCNRRKVQLVP